MKRRFLCAVAFLFVFCGLTWADEGMWLFNQPPKDRIKGKYGFELTEPWLHHLQTGSVRFNNGGSGSLVSADGLVFTNHHVGRVCLQDLSTADKDYIKNGFIAKSQAEEGKCPDLELNVLMEIQDVTTQVQGAAKANMSVAEQGQAIRAMQSQLESECAKATGLRCDVVTLYAGGMYHLYKYKKYTDVRVVFAPEAQMAFFGGDADNFEFPRYDLDITFFRIYENDKPVHVDNFLQFSHSGMKDGDLVFVSGHPGSTERLLTMAQLNFLRDVQTPYMLDRLGNIDNALKKFSSESAENARVSADLIFGIENSLKAYKGRNHGLHDPELTGGKQAAEDKLRKAVDADAKLKSEYGDVWTQIAGAVQKQRELFVPYALFERNAAFMGDLPAFARTLVRVTAEKQKPNNERLREYSEARLPPLEQSLFSTAPVYKSLDEVTLTTSLRFMLSKLGPNDPMVKMILNGQTPEQVAHNAIANTKLDDPAFRKQLYEGGLAAVAASNDPLIALMRTIDPEARKLRKQWDDQVQSVLIQNSTRLAKARFAVLGTDTYPDATFTLRLSYGVIKGYVEDGQGIVPKGTKVAPFTEMGGTYEHAAKHGNKGDYELPKSWVAAKPKLALNTRYNYVSTADIIGGNSGSPTVDKKGEVVGIIFDGNIQGLPWDFAYEDRIGRAVHVDVRAIFEALHKIYGAEDVASELWNGGRNAMAAPSGLAATTH
jgi:hypothetical protein